MKTSITAHQMGHYATFGWIELEGFLSKQECEAISLAILETVAKRLSSTKDKLPRVTSDRLYLAGRDLWRDDPYLKQFFQSKNLLSTASQLTNKQHLVLASDQWIPAGHTLSPLNMSTHLSFQQLICGCLLSLEDGNARFMHPDRLPLYPHSQILIAYGTSTSVYVHNLLDPSNHLLKQFGYNFGDRLKSPSSGHPKKP
jgi:hypothetical protein